MKPIVLEMAEFFKALGDPNRLKIIKMLNLNSENGLCVGELAEHLGISQPAVSQHLKVLKYVGIAEPTRIGVRVHYRVNREALTSFREKMDELCRLANEPGDCEDCQELNETDHASTTQ